MTRLAELAVGQRARVMEIVSGDDIGLRLLEMGLTPGVELVVMGTAPLGDPLEIEIRGYRLSVRKSEALRVEVERIDAASHTP